MQILKLEIVSYDACFSFVIDLDEVTTKIAKLVSSDPSRAVVLYETFLGACYVETKALDRLAELVRRTKDDDLEDLGHYVTEPVARKSEKPHPDLAARLWRA